MTDSYVKNDVPSALHETEGLIEGLDPETIRVDVEVSNT